VNLIEDKHVRSSNLRILPGKETAYELFWSPDSSTIGYLSDGQLHSISVQGTNHNVLAAAPDPAGAAWRGGVSDGEIFFASARSLRVLDLATRKVRELALKLPESERALQPVFLPEGDGFVYLGGPLNAPQLFQSSLRASGAGRFLLDTHWRIEFARHPRTGQWHIFYLGSLYPSTPLQFDNAATMSRSFLVTQIA